jgi:hypothetical protein
MQPSAITPATLFSVVHDPAHRAALLAALEAETGTRLPLHDAVARAAEACVATPDELAEMVELLLPEEAGYHVLDSLVFHPDMPERCLFRLLDAGLCTCSLGHRRGPEELLLRVAAEHPEVGEAVPTLALCHYGPDPQRGDRFLEFVREHLHDDWLRKSLMKSDLTLHIPPDRLAASLELVEAYERAR